MRTRLLLLAFSFISFAAFSQRDRASYPDTTIGLRVSTERKFFSFDTAFYRKGQRVIDVMPFVHIRVSSELQLYELGSSASYGRFVKNNLLVRAGMLYQYGWVRGDAPERYNAHVIGPIIGMAYHIPMRWAFKPYVGVESRYDFFSYIPEGRIVLFNDKPTGKRVWHAAPALRFTAGFMFHLKEYGSSVGFNTFWERQFYPKSLIPSGTPAPEGFTDGWSRFYALSYRYTFRR